MVLEKKNGSQKGKSNAQNNLEQPEQSRKGSHNPS